MMSAPHGAIGAVAGTDQLAALLVLLDDPKRFKSRIAELEQARANANAAIAKLSKAKDIDKALKNADARETKSAEMLDAAMVESVAIRDEAKIWIADESAKLAGMEADLAAREKTLLSEGKINQKLVLEQTEGIEKREAEAYDVLKRAEVREAEATAAHEKWSSALARARGMTTALEAG